MRCATRQVQAVPILLVLFAAFPASALFNGMNTVELARDGRTPYVIVEAEDAVEPETFAAQELSAYLTRIVGAPFCVVSESDVAADVHGIYVGQTRFAARNGIDVSRLGDEEWELRTIGSDIVVAGGWPRGTLYAAYEFLERAAGVYWLDPETEVVPSEPRLRIPKLDLCGRPAFDYRFIQTGAEQHRPDLAYEDGLFRIRNKANDGIPLAHPIRAGSPGKHHTFEVYAAGLAATHPEYFSLSDSGRRDVPGAPTGGQLCLTNQELLLLVIERLRDFIARDRGVAAARGEPVPRVYDISPNRDPERLCRCSVCCLISDYEESESGLLLEFVNSVADAVRDDHPSVRIRVLAESATRDPPRTVVPRRNVVVCLRDTAGREYFKALTHALNKEAAARLTRWSEIAPHLAVWDVWGPLSPGSFPTPHTNVSLLKPDLELLLSRGVESVRAQCTQPETASFFALKHWLGYKLLQAPGRAVDPLVDVFMAGYYGRAAPAMHKYLRYLEKRIAKTRERMATRTESERAYLLDVDFYTTSQRYLDQAELECKAGSPELLHVRRERIPLDSALHNLWDRLSASLKPGRTLPFDRGAILMRYEANRYAQAEYFRSHATLAASCNEIAAEVERFRELMGPEPR